MKMNKLLDYVFDEETKKGIVDFCNEINASAADIYIAMARKAACFVQFLVKEQLLNIHGELITDRLLDFDTSWLVGKNVILIDDVIVSGTTLYTTIKKLESANVNSVQVMVLGVDKEYFNVDLFDYITSEGEQRNYIKQPYLLLTDAGCIRMCSNIVAIFALDKIPYDVDFPQHHYISLSKMSFEQMLQNNEWDSYDVSSDLQSENNIKNITLLPTSDIMRKYDSLIGIPISKKGFCKIRLFIDYKENKKRQFTVNAIPYFLFNEIEERDVRSIYSQLFRDDMDGMSVIAKIRMLQYIFAKKLYDLWIESVELVVKRKLENEIEKNTYMRIFPPKYWNSMLDIINSKKPLLNRGIELHEVDLNHIKDNTYSNLDRKQNNVVLQSKLVGLFTDLYHKKEMESRSIVKKYGYKAFEMSEYKEIINRLNHGYSYKDMISYISAYSDIYDIEVTVSLFIDEAIDAGIAVPIIAEEYNVSCGKFYYRAYRHGEDVPFGELQEKMCAVLLTSFKKMGSNKALSKLRIEKILVLFLRIGLNQKLFRPCPQDSIYYNVNIDAYIHGNIATIQDTTSKRKRHYIKYRTEISWLTDILKEKDIIQIDENGKVVDVADPIVLPLDNSTIGKIAAIGTTFGILYKNNLDKLTPAVSDDDLVIFSSCM